MLLDISSITVENLSFVIGTLLTLFIVFGASKITHNKICSKLITFDKLKIEEFRIHLPPPSYKDCADSYIGRAIMQSPCYDTLNLPVSGVSEKDITYKFELESYTHTPYLWSKD